MPDLIDAHKKLMEEIVNENGNYHAAYKTNSRRDFKTIKEAIDTYENAN